MVMTIASAIISLGLVYNIVAGGNKLGSKAASDSPAPDNSNHEEASSSQGWSDTNNPSTNFGWQVHPQMCCCCLSAAPRSSLQMCQPLIYNAKQLKVPIAAQSLLLPDPGIRTMRRRMCAVHQSSAMTAQHLYHQMRFGPQL